jgi:hypothetical protein
MVSFGNKLDDLAIPLASPFATINRACSGEERRIAGTIPTSTMRAFTVSLFISLRARTRNQRPWRLGFAYFEDNNIPEFDAEIQLMPLRRILVHDAMADKPKNGS